MWPYIISMIKQLFPVNFVLLAVLGVEDGSGSGRCLLGKRFELALLTKSTEQYAPLALGPFRIYGLSTLKKV